MTQFEINMGCHEGMVQECIAYLRLHPIEAHNFIWALLEGQTVSFHGYQFTDYDTRRIYNAIKSKGRNY